MTSRGYFRPVEVQRKATAATLRMDPQTEWNTEAVGCIKPLSIPYHDIGGEGVS